MTPEDARHLQIVETELGREFAQLPTQDVEAAVRHAWHDLDGAKVRDYVPLLASREARLRLRVLVAHPVA